MNQITSHFILSKVPITLWVLGTIQKMNNVGAVDKRHWDANWLETYGELGGFVSSGKKTCPKAAAYGLWFFGRLRDGGRTPLDFWTKDRVTQSIGKNKNITYAIIAADLLAQGASTSLKDLWPVVQAQYTSRTGHQPAKEDQGEIKLVIALFCEKQLITN